MNFQTVCGVISTCFYSGSRRAPASSGLRARTAANLRPFPPDRRRAGEAAIRCGSSRDRKFIIQNSRFRIMNSGHSLLHSFGCKFRIQNSKLRTRGAACGARMFGYELRVSAAGRLRAAAPIRAQIQNSIFKIQNHALGRQPAEKPFKADLWDASCGPPPPPRLRPADL